LTVVEGLVLGWWGDVVGALAVEAMLVEPLDVGHGGELSICGLRA
jgi:hypothetical protein